MRRFGTLSLVTGPRAGVATDRWEGRFRHDFDVDDAAVDVRILQLIPVLRALAGGIEQAAPRPRAEQVRREAERARWRSENSAADGRRAEEAMSV